YPRRSLRRAPYGTGRLRPCDPSSTSRARMLRQAIRELWRHAIRSLLTAGGIAIGVGALVLLGALSERTSRLVEGGRDFGAGQITVSGSGGDIGTGMTRGALVGGEQLAALGKVPGASQVAPIVMFPVSESPTSIPFTLTPLLFGVHAPPLGPSPPPTPPVSRVGVAVTGGSSRSTPPRGRVGKFVPSPDRNEVVIGTQVAEHFGADVGSTIQVRGKDFNVVGVLEPTLTGPDSFVMMPFATAERLLLDSEPVLRRLAMVPGTSVLPIATPAYGTAGRAPQQVAERSRKSAPGLSVVSPKQAAAQLDSALAFLRSVIDGGGLVALLVASLAVANTTFTAMVERRREIALWRVV